MLVGVDGSPVKVTHDSGGRAPESRGWARPCPSPNAGSMGSVSRRAVTPGRGSIGEDHVVPPEGARCQHPRDAWLIGGAVTTNVHGRLLPDVKVRSAVAVDPFFSAFFHMCSVTVERMGGMSVHPGAASRVPTSSNKVVRVPAKRKRAWTTTDDQPKVPGRPSQLVWCGSDLIRYGSVVVGGDDLHGRAGVP